MDGNGRWAAQHGLERFEGHIRGVESVRRAIQAATRHGVRYLTLYAFSTENWGRPAAEVDALMELFCKSVINETPELAAQGVRVRIIGDKSRFPEKVKHHLDQIENRTATGKRLTPVSYTHLFPRCKGRRNPDPPNGENETEYSTKTRQLFL